MPNHPRDPAPLLAFGAHPDDIEFGCGGVVAAETRAGRAVHLVVCSRGESATNGTPLERTRETEAAAALLGATVEFVELDGDAHLEVRVAHAIRLAGVIRRVRPGIVLAPSPVPNQHPDHSRLGHIVRDATRLARYGGLEELKDAPSHTIDHLFFYALTPESEPRDVTPILINISDPEIVATWTEAMNAHATQQRTRNYTEMQLTRARLNGLRAGVGHAIALFPNAPPAFESLAQLGRNASFF
jgi:LmbE family N-acetylglucosaminyl deacetylase